MLSRRDQLQSYQFLMQRVTSALVLRETDPLTPPFRRFLVAGFSSLVVACVALAACGIYGLLRPGGKESWRAGDKVILERETGAMYVFRDGTLYRLANYTSGVLLLGRNNGTVTVTRRSLLDVPRGPELGIAGAPSGLPRADSLLGAPWTLCSRNVSDASGTNLAATVLAVGSQVDGGTPVGDQGLMVTNIETNELFLVVDGHRHKVTDAPAALVGLGLGQEPRVRVGSAWMTAVPAGVPVAPPTIPGRGKPSAFPGTLIGQLLTVPTAGGDNQYYVAVRDGLRSLSAVEFALLFASKATAAAYPKGVPDKPRTITAAQAAPAVLPVAPATGPEQLPRARPSMSSLADPDAVLCTVFRAAGSTPVLTIGARPAVRDTDLVTARQTRAGTVLADRVLVPGGHGAIVEAVQGDRLPGVLELVTEQGMRYPLASPEVLRVLGYPSSAVLRLPAELIARIPEGVALDPAAAGTVLLSN
jgi:type VII secretion protein EccB